MQHLKQLIKYISIFLVWYEIRTLKLLLVKAHQKYH